MVSVVVHTRVRGSEYWRFESLTYTAHLKQVPATSQVFVNLKRGTQASTVWDCKIYSLVRLKNLKLIVHFSQRFASSWD